MKWNIKTWHVILVILLLLVIFKMSNFNMQSFLAMSLINPETNETYACNTTVDCYDQILTTFTGPLPPITCDNATGKCVETACLPGGTDKSCVSDQVCCSRICGDGGYCWDCTADLTETCWDQSTITAKKCEDGFYVDTSEVCPAYECIADENCDYTSDENCDGKLDPIDGQCILHKCTKKVIKTCSQQELLWGKYGVYILISGAAALIAIAFYLGRGQKNRKA